MKMREHNFMGEERGPFKGGGSARASVAFFVPVFFESVVFMCFSILLFQGAELSGTRDGYR